MISQVTDAVMEDARAWQQRPLEDVYPVLFLDACIQNLVRSVARNHMFSTSRSPSIPTSCRRASRT